MWGNKNDLSDLKERIEKLERQMGYLFRSFGIETGEAPSWQPSSKVIALVSDGKKMEAIKAFREESGVSLKDAKLFIESFESKKTK